METERKKPFKTSSLPLVAYLFAQGATFTAIERRGPTVYFQFSNCEHVVSSYYNQGMVVAARYWEGLQQAKDLIYNP